MRNLYYSLMPKLLAALLLFATAAIPQTQNDPQPAKAPHMPYTDSHEGMTLGVDPWMTTSRYKQKFPKKSPFTGGVVALEVSFRNDNDKGVKVDLQRIRLLIEVSEDNRQELEPMTAEDVADTVLLKQHPKDPTQRRLPIPIPSTGPKPARDSNWTTLRDACQNAAVPSNVIGAHSSVEGLIYFDIRGELDLLQSARLYVPNLATMGNNEPISYFDINISHSSEN